MKKLWIWIGIAVIVVLAILLGVTQTKKESEEIKIGAILTLSGEAALYGQSAKNAMEMGMDEINSNNFLNGKHLTLIFEDDQLDPKTGISAFRKLIDFDKVPVVLGPLTSTVTLAIAPIANERKIVLLSPSASSPAITTAGDFIFRNVASDEFETKVMADFAADSLKFEKVGILYINNDFGKGYKDYFTTFFTKKGGTVSIAETYEQNSSDFRSQLTKIKSSGVEALYLIGYKEMGIVLRQAGELGVKTQVLSYSAIEDPDIILQAGKSADGIIYTRQSFDPNDPDNIVNRFSSSYRKLYGKDPDAFAALSYDALMILSEALKKGNNSESIRDALYSIKDFPGVTGMTSFDSNGDVNKSISLKQIRNGSFIYLGKNYYTP